MNIYTIPSISEGLNDPIPHSGSHVTFNENINNSVFPDEIPLPSRLSTPRDWRNCTHTSPGSSVYCQVKPKRGILCRNKSFSSSAIPTINITNDHDFRLRSSPESRRMSLVDAEPAILNYKTNSLTETQCTYLSHPNLSSNPIQGLYSMGEIYTCEQEKSKDRLFVELPNMKESFLSVFKRRYTK